MKTIVRAFVAALVLTGVVASTQTSSASTQNKVTVAKVSMLPDPQLRSRRSERLWLGNHPIAFQATG
jgi:hypothetical protein